MHNILLQCCFDMQNLNGKSVTILKLLIRAIICCQAEIHRSIRLDSTSKRLSMLILRNCKKLCRGTSFQSSPILFIKTSFFRCKRFLNSKKVILNTGLMKMVINLIRFEIKPFLHPAWTFIFSKIVTLYSGRFCF